MSKHEMWGWRYEGGTGREGPFSSEWEAMLHALRKGVRVFRTGHCNMVGSIPMDSPIINIEHEIYGKPE